MSKRRKVPARAASAVSRRDFLGRVAGGFGVAAGAGLMGQSARAMPLGFDERSMPLVSHGQPMFAPRAKRVIFVFMQGGPSHVDTFDYKPELLRADGKSIDFRGVRFGTFGKMSKRRLMRPLWRFAQHGECGRWVSELFPYQAGIVDKLCFVHSMRTEGVAHGPSTLFLHTGATNLVRPSIGSWIHFALGSLNPKLPGFVTIGPSATKGGPRNYANAFLPAIHQGTAIGMAGRATAAMSIPHLTPKALDEGEQLARLDLIRRLNELQRRAHPGDSRLAADVEAFELAHRMQQEAPKLLDLSTESEATRRLYGIGEGPSDDFGRQCLLARRLCEAGVRYVQVNYADESPNPRWDQHSNMPAHAKHALATDQPVAALISDLDARGLLEDTLVWWGGEFGRTPFAQGRDGRDHNPRGFTIWLAGGGTRPGVAIGSTDELGHHAVERPVHMHDLHATILHLLGLDHERLTYKYAGRDFRLTDVNGEVVPELLA